MNYYRRYIGDYMRDTRVLSMIEHGAYTLLLDTQYSTEEGLPEDLDALYRICGAISNTEQAAVRKVADKFFPVEDGVRWNPRAHREVGIGQATIAKQRKSGAESAAKRWAGNGSEDGLDDGSIDGSADESTHGYTDESSGGSAIQPPTTNHQPPTASLQPPAAKEPRALASRLPQDWVATEAHLAFCRQLRPDLDPPTVADRFRDYWVAVPGAKGRKLDWFATWRNWVRNETRGSTTKPLQESERDRSRRQAYEQLTGNDGQHTIDGVADRVD